MADKPFPTHEQSIKFLTENCPAYHALAQFAIDQLSAVNLMLEASVVHDADFMSKIVTKRLREIQNINKSVMARIRGEG
jgi:hypothetical protein